MLRATTNAARSIRLFGALMVAASLVAVGGPSAQSPAPPAEPRRPLVVPIEPEQLAVFPFDPPLGVLDAVLLSERTRAQLEIALGETPPNETRLRLCRRALDEIILYAQEEDERRVTLDSYAWRLLLRADVKPGEPRPVSIRLAEPMPSVNALAMRAEGARVLAENIGATTPGPIAAPELSRDTIYLRQDSPRREIAFFYEPARLDGFSATFTTDQSPKAVVEVWAGVSNVVENGKSALRLLRIARRELDEFRFRDASAHLLLAEDQLRRFHDIHYGALAGPAPARVSAPTPAPKATAAAANPDETSAAPDTETETP